MADLNSLYPIVFLFEALLALVISGLILSKNPNYYFNRFFSFIVFIFANYFLFESLIYFMYDADLLILNLFKDISLTATHVASFSFFVTALILIHGKHAIQRRITIVSGIFAVLSLVLAALDEAVEPITTSVNFSRTPLLGHLVTYGVPLLFLIAGIILYYRQLSKMDEKTRKKLQLLLTGMIIFLISVIYFATFRFTVLPELLGPFADVLGSIGYSVGLIFLLLSFW